MGSRSSGLVAILLIGAALAAILSAHLPLDGMWSGDQGAKYIQITSLIRRGLTDLTLLYPGADLDPAGEFSPVPALYTVPGETGAVSTYSYLYAFLCAGLVELLGPLGFYLPSVAAALGILFISVGVSRRLGSRASPLLPWILAAASPMLFYAVSFWEHALAAFVAAASMALGAEAVWRREVPWALGAGGVAGLTFLVRPEALYVGIAVATAVAVAPQNRARLAAATLAGWLAGLLPAVAFNVAVYGRPLGGGVALNFGGNLVEKLVSGRGRIVATMIFDQSFYWKYYLVLVLLAAVVGFTAGKWRALALLALSLAAARGWVLEEGLFLKTGLVASCPLVLLVLTRRRGPSPVRELLRFLQVFVGSYLLAVVLTAPNGGGAQWGPRYLLPILAPVVLLAFHHAEHLVRSARQVERLAVGIGLGVLLLLSVALQVHSLRVLEHSLARGETINSAAASAGHDVVLTDFWWGAQILAPLYFERRIFLLHQPRQLGGFVATLEAQGIRDFVFVVTQEWSRDLEGLRASRAACRSAAEFAGGLFVLDCRVTPSPSGRASLVAPAETEEAPDPLQPPPPP